MVELTLKANLTSPPTEDASLLAEIAAGSPQALETLHALYADRLYAYALRVLGDPAAAQDALQESLLTVWQKAGSYRAEGSVLAWLLGIVHRQALRSLRRKPTLALEDLPQEPPANLPPPDARLQQADRRRVMQQALNCLPAQQRAVLELVFYQGMNQQQAAQICGIPLGTVKSRLNHAKAALKAILEREGIPLEDLK